MRRLSALVSVEDVLGLAALALLAYGSWLLDPRLVFFVLGFALLILAVSRSIPEAPPPPPQEP